MPARSIPLASGDELMAKLNNGFYFCHYFCSSCNTRHIAEHFRKSDELFYTKWKAFPLKVNISLIKILHESAYYIKVFQIITRNKSLLIVKMYRMLVWRTRIHYRKRCLKYSNELINLRPTPWTQDVNWTYIIRSEDVQDVFWRHIFVQFTFCVQGVNFYIEK